jgi:uncharacterized protein (TIGR00251 family)
MANERNFELHDGKTGSALAVRITPRCTKNELTGILDDGTVKVRLVAPNVEEQANLALVKYLAEILQVSALNIEIVAGIKGKDKLVTILGIDSPTLQKRIISRIE